MLHLLRNTQHLQHYVAYSLSAMMYGMIVVCIGAVIPYLADQTGHQETEYSFLLASKCYGMLIGALVMNYIQKSHFCPSNHGFMVYSGLGILITCILFTQSKSLFFQGTWIFFGSICYMILDVQINVCAITLSEQKMVQSWLQIIWGLFSVGGIIGPGVVYLFGKNAYLVIGAFAGITSCFYYYLKSPQILKQQEKTTDNSKKEEEEKRHKVNSYVYCMLCLMIFLYLGSITNIVIWGSSYAVISGICTKQQATIFPALFFCFMTGTRFIVALLPWSSSQKLKYSLIGVIFTGIVTLLLLQTEYKLFAMYFQSVSFAICISSVFAIIYSLGSEFGFHLQSYQTSRIATFGVLGEGMVAPVTGYLMSNLNIDILYISVVLMMSLMLLCRSLVINQFKRVLRNEKAQIQIQLIQKI